MSYKEATAVEAAEMYHHAVKKAKIVRNAASVLGSSAEAEAVCQRTVRKAKLARDAIVPSYDEAFFNYFFGQYKYKTQ